MGSGHVPPPPPVLRRLLQLLLLCAQRHQGYQTLNAISRGHWPVPTRVGRPRELSSGSLCPCCSRHAPRATRGGGHSGTAHSTSACLLFPHHAVACACAFFVLAAGGVELTHAYGVSRLGKPASDVYESCLRGPCHTQLQSAVMDGGGATSRCLGTPGALVAVAGLFSSAIRDSRRSRSLGGMP